MTEKQASKMIKMLNYNAGVKQVQTIDETSFVKALTETFE